MFLQIIQPAVIASVTKQSRENAEHGLLRENHPRNDDAKIRRLQHELQRRAKQCNKKIR